MVNLRKVLVILFVVLPVIIAGCQVSVSQSKTSTGGRYNTYTAVITNTGNEAVSQVVLSTSTTLKSVTGMTEVNGNYELPSSQNGLEAGATYDFTYTVKNGNSVSWSTSCTAASTSATAAPTSKSTSAPKATSAPTQAASKSTSAPTTASTGSSPTAGRVCPSGTVWHPSPLTTWQWQLTGTIDTSINVQMYDIDLFDNAQSVIDTLHKDGRVVICYFSTQYENWRPDSSSFTAAVLGNNLDDWAGEKWVDIRSTVVRNIMLERLDLAASKNCDGVEPDNVDGYQNDSGFPLTAADQLNFNEFIATSAHARGLSVGLKNDVDQATTLQPYFDWALDEQCYQYHECDTLTPFITAGKAVFNAEYKGTGSTVCPYMIGMKFSSLIKTLDLTAAITAECCTYNSPACANAPYTCVAPASSSSLLADSAPILETVAPQITHEASAATSAASTSFAMMAVAAAALVVLNL